MRTTAALPAIAIACLWSCTSNPDLVAPRQSAGPSISASSWGPEAPPFNNEIILRDLTGYGDAAVVCSSCSGRRWPRAPESIRPVLEACGLAAQWRYLAAWAVD